MGLGVFDIVLMFSLKSVLRVFYYFESIRWERTRALVTGQAVQKPIWGCPSVILHYKVDSAGGSAKGCDVHPFIGVLQAKAWAASFPHNFPVTIRVNPKKSQETRFFEWDQKGGYRIFVNSLIAAIVVVAVIVLVTWISKKVG